MASRRPIFPGPTLGCSPKSILNRTTRRAIDRDFTLGGTCGYIRPNITLRPFHYLATASGEFAMRPVWSCALGVVASTFVLNHAARAQSAPASQPAPAACTSTQDFFASDCPLTWHGITLYGAYDVGVGWVSHGMPTSGYNYEGESLVNRNGNHSMWLIAPNNLQQSGLGIRGGKSLCTTGSLSSTRRPASIRSPASSPTRQPPWSPTPASPGPAIRPPSTARAQANPSMTNSTAGYPRRISAR